VLTVLAVVAGSSVVLAAQAPPEVSVALGDATGWDQRLYFGGGVLATHLMGSSSQDGVPAFAGSYQVETHLMGAIPLGSGVFGGRARIVPWAAYTPLATSMSDGAGVVRRFQWGVGGAMTVMPNISVTVGAGMTNEFRTGAGGTVSLPNGNSTSVNYLPGGNSVSRVFFVDVGGGYQVMSRVRVDVKLQLAGLGSKRFHSHMLLLASAGVF